MNNLKIMALEDKCNKQYETIVKLNDEKIDLFKENQQLKEQNEFLIKRENKLQQIEMMFKNNSVDLEELSNLILEGMK